MSKSIACIVFDNSQKKIFIAKRQNKGDMGGRWEFPGGKIDEGENEEIAIKREMNEEFGVNVKVLQKITQSTFFHGQKKCFLYVYEVEFENNGIEKRFELTEHTDYRWENLEEIPKLNFVDSDLAIYDEVCNYLQKKYDFKIKNPENKNK